MYNLNIINDNVNEIINILLIFFIINDNLIVINWKMGIKNIFSSKNGPDWAGPGFQSPAHLKPILILKGPYPARPIFT